jgi:hypothetical protein
MDENWLPWHYPDAQGAAGEAALVERMRQAQPAPRVVPLASVLSAALPRPVAGGAALSGPRFFWLVGSDPWHHLNSPLLRHAVYVVPVAANGQQSFGGATPSLSHYALNPHAGAAISMATVDATVLRRAYGAQCDFGAHWLDRYDPEDPATHLRRCFDYEGGDLTPRLGQAKDGLSLIRAHGGQLSACIQQVRVDGAGEADDQYMTHVSCFGLNLLPYHERYAAAPGSDLSADASESILVLRDSALVKVAVEPGISALCEGVLSWQYQFAAKIAVLKAWGMRQQIPFIVRPVGGESGENDLYAIARALESIGAIVDHQPVDVVLCVNRLEYSFYQSQLPFLASAQVLTQADVDSPLFQAAAPAALAGPPPPPSPLPKRRWGRFVPHTV